MAAARYCTTLVVFEKDTPEVVSPGGEIIELEDPRQTVSRTSLLQGNSALDIEAIRGIHRDTPLTLQPETRPIDEYDSPLTYEEMQRTYGRLYSADTDGWLLSTVIGSAEHEQARQQAKKEITRTFLHKMGMPSDYMRYLDIDRTDTRTILHDLYFAIPEEVDRDNSLNGFFSRVAKIHPHIIETSDRPDIREKLDTIIEVWIADIDQRALVLRQAVGKTAIESIAVEREAYIQQYLRGEGHPQTLIQRIGNCLLQADEEEIRALYDRLPRSSQDTTQAKRLHMLRTNIEQFHLKKTEQ